VKAAFVLSLFVSLGCSRREAAPAPPPSQQKEPAHAVSASSTEAPSRNGPAIATPVASSAAATAVMNVPPGQFYAPNLSGSEVAPLLVLLHGLGASGKGAFDVLGLRALGEKERTFVVAPDGSVDARGRRFWNAHPACCDFDRTGVDDVERLGKLIDDIASRHAVDRSRIYVVGFSNGGFMAQRLACRLGDRIAAFASIAGASPPAEEACTIGAPLGALAVHGDADDVVSYQGGTLFQRTGTPSHASARDTFAFWAERLGCQGKPTPGPRHDFEPKLEGEETLTESRARCKLGGAALWTVEGGGHLIGTRPKFVEQVWRFLEAYRKH
jgi:polyhydroxybutyrate depolymerase